MRQTIFISHATPEDNDFARWLAGKLSIAGYEVWCDLDRLKGGDVFWSKIESAIRNDCIRMIAVVSKASYQKDGVRNEWELGTTVEKTIPGFVIPVRVDKFQFDQLPITLLRKNVLDFSRGWHLGLGLLMESLENVVARTATLGAAGAMAFLPELPDGAVDWVDRPEVLDSNWVAITALPPAVETAKILGNSRQLPVTDGNKGVPWFELGDQVAGFAPRQELVNIFKGVAMLDPATAVDTETLITSGVNWGSNQVRPGDARNRVGALVRQAWDLKMEALGLKRYELSSRKNAWYVPSGLLPKGKASFVETNGKVRKKQLTGTSAKFKVNWHYAVSAHPVLEGLRRIELRAHIIFTDLDGNPIESAPRMHKLRRGFCKNWWNDRWRGFLRAFMAFAAEGGEVLSLPVGGGRVISLCSTPVTFEAPRGLSDIMELSEDEDVTLEESNDYEPGDDDDVSAEDEGE